MSDTPRNIVVTGAAGGLGSALSVACARRGARLLLLDRNLKGLGRTCDLVEQEGGPAPGYCQLDLAVVDPEDCARLVDDFVETYGPLDGLAHCAAQFDGLRPLDQVPGDIWLSHLQVNLNAAWLLTVSCLPTLRASGRGAVVFVLDDERRSQSAYWGPYGVSKAALRALAGMFAEELEGSGCRVWGVDPGPMRTALRANAYMAEPPETHPSPRAAAEHVAALLMGEEVGWPVIHAVPQG